MISACLLFRSLSARYVTNFNKCSYLLGIWSNLHFLYQTLAIYQQSPLTYHKTNQQMTGKVPFVHIKQGLIFCSHFGYLEIVCIKYQNITKTRLFKYIENFTSKNWKFSDKKIWYFSYFCSKHRLWVLVRTASARRFSRVPTIYVFEQK